MANAAAMSFWMDVGIEDDLLVAPTWISLELRCSNSLGPV
jgi:hypothetical protein